MPTHKEVLNSVQLALLKMFSAETNTNDDAVAHAIPSANAVREPEHTGTAEEVKARKHQRGLECFCCGVQ